MIFIVSEKNVHCLHLTGQAALVTVQRGAALYLFKIWLTNTKQCSTAGSMIDRVRQKYRLLVSKYIQHNIEFLYKNRNKIEPNSR